MLTSKEKKVLRLLMSSFDKDFSINQIAKECGLSPNGALKILRKFEKEGILVIKNIANIKSYKVNFGNEKTDAVLELALIPHLEGRIKYRLEDFRELKEMTNACVLFGSYINLKKEPHDLDVLFVLNKAQYKEYKERLSSVRDIVPARIHDIIQTEEDLKKNVLREDKAILEIIKNGYILWGQKLIIKVIKDVNQGKTGQML